ncbi:MAG: PDDEXK nuclease domain-containing protein [Christensenellaceae bacterium]|jgi:predicted nuclease of restriction endonuclease-like (RecB) superfamily|nr:PDDEXK nuclease domain-containing protein [Christensenellaceae bacterium]
MTKKDKKVLAPVNAELPDTAEGNAVDEAALFRQVSAIIEQGNGKAHSAAAYVNREINLMYWTVGNCINATVLAHQRAQYGKRVVETLAAQLQKLYGRGFEHSNLTRMMKFAARFPNITILVPLVQELGWSHILALLPLKSDDAFMYYAKYAVAGRLGRRDLRLKIESKVYERHEIFDAQLSPASQIPPNVFKDPHFLDVLDLKDNYSEKDLEQSILRDLEAFILEFGKGFAFLERQKRMVVDGKDFYLDLLFYHRNLKRLIAVELKIVEFKLSHKGQMELYLNWLNEHERKEGEEAPIGIILCTTAHRATVELLRMDKAGIGVAEYWTQLPPKDVLEAKIRALAAEARERIERRRDLSSVVNSKQITDYFYEHKEDDDE